MRILNMDSELLYKLYQFDYIVTPQQEGAVQILTADRSVGESHTLSQC